MKIKKKVEVEIDTYCGSCRWFKEIYTYGESTVDPYCTYFGRNLDFPNRCQDCIDTFGGGE